MNKTGLTDGHKGWKIKSRSLNNTAVTTTADACDDPGPDTPDAGGPQGLPLITVAICTRNRARSLEQAVRSVLPQISHESEVLIVDNGSTDDTARTAATLAASNPRVTACREDRLGIAVARNTALAQARGEYVLFFDDDEIAEAGWLDAYRRFLSRPPSEKLASVGGEVIPHFEITPPAWINPANFVMNFGSQARRLDGDSFPGCGNCAYHRQRALGVGGFCTRLARYEESELSMRLQRAGFEIWWLPGASILHLIPADHLNLRWLAHIAFSEGRAVALVRLRGIGPKIARIPYVLGRLALAPVHCLLNLFAAGLLLPKRRGQVAARSLLRAVRIAGQGWQLLMETASTLFRSHSED